MAELTLNDKFSGTLKKYSKGMEDMTKQTESASQAVQKYAGRIALASTLMGKLSPKIAEFSNVTDYFAKNNVQIKAGTAVLNKFNEKIKDMAKEIEPLALIMPEIDPLFKTMKAGQITLDGIDKTVTNIASKFVETHEETEETNGIWSKLKIPVIVVSTITAIGVGLLGVDKGLQAIALHADAIALRGKKIQETYNGVKTSISKGGDKIKETFDATKNKIGECNTKLQEFASDKWTKLTTNATAALTSVKAFATRGAGMVKTFSIILKDLAIIGNDVLRQKFLLYDIFCTKVGAVYGKIKEKMTAFYDAYLKGTVEKVVTFFKTHYSSSKEFLSKGLSKVKDYWKNVKNTSLKGSMSAIAARALEFAVSTKLFKAFTKDWSDKERKRFIRRVTSVVEVTRIENGVEQKSLQRQLDFSKLKEAYKKAEVKKAISEVMKEKMATISAKIAENALVKKISNNEKVIAFKTAAAAIGARAFEFAVSTKLFKKFTKTWTDGQRQRLINAVTTSQTITKVEDGQEKEEVRRLFSMKKMVESISKYREAKAKEVSLAEVAGITFKQRAEARADAFSKWRLRFATLRGIAHHAADYLWMKFFYEKKKVTFDAYITHCKSKIRSFADNTKSTVKSVAKNVANGVVSAGKAAGSFWSQGVKGQLNELLKTVKSIPGLLYKAMIAFAGFTIISETASKLIDVTKGLEALKNKIDEVAEKFEFMGRKARRSFLFGSDEAANGFAQFAKKMSLETGQSVGEIMQAGENLRHLGVGQENIERILKMSHTMSTLAPNIDFSSAADSFRNAIQSGSGEALAGFFGGGAGVERKLRRMIRRKFAHGDVAGGLDQFKKVADLYGYTEEKANKMNDNIYVKLRKASNQVGSMVNQIRMTFATKLEPIIEHVIEYLNSDGFKMGFEKYKRMLVVAMDAVAAAYEKIKPIVHTIIDLIWAPPNEAGDSIPRQIIRFIAHVTMLSKAFMFLMAPLMTFLGTNTIFRRFFGFIGFGVRGVIAGFARFKTEMQEAAKTKKETDKDISKPVTVNVQDGKLKRIQNQILHFGRTVRMWASVTPTLLKNTVGRSIANVARTIYSPIQRTSDFVYNSAHKMKYAFIDFGKNIKVAGRQVVKDTKEMAANLHKESIKIKAGFKFAMRGMSKEMRQLNPTLAAKYFRTGLKVMGQSTVRMAAIFIQHSARIVRNGIATFVRQYPAIGRGIRRIGEGAIRLARQAARSVKIIGNSLKFVAKGIGKAFKSFAGFLLDPFTIIPIAITILGKLGQKFARDEGKGEVGFVEGLIHIITTGIVKMFAFIKNKFIDLRIKIKDSLAYIKNFWIDLWNSIAEMIEDNPILQKLGIKKGSLKIEHAKTSKDESKDYLEKRWSQLRFMAEVKKGSINAIGDAGQFLISNFNLNRYADAQSRKEDALVKDLKKMDYRFIASGTSYMVDQAAMQKQMAKDGLWNGEGWHEIAEGQVSWMPGQAPQMSVYESMTSQMKNGQPNQSNAMTAFFDSRDKFIEAGQNFKNMMSFKADEAQAAEIEKMFKEMAEFQQDPEAYQKKLMGYVSDEEAKEMIASFEKTITGGFNKLYDNLKGLMGEDTLQELLEKTGLNLESNKKTEEETGKIRQAMSHEQDLRWMKEMAEQRFVNRVNVRQLTPTVNVQVRSQASAQDIGNVIKKTLQEEAARSSSISYGDAG